MLQPNAALRPTCRQLLQLQAVIEKVRYLSQFDKNILNSLQTSIGMSASLKLAHSFSQGNFQESKASLVNDGALLETIKLPRMLNHFQKVLPKSNYEVKSQRFKHFVHNQVQK